MYWDPKSRITILEAALEIFGASGDLLFLSDGFKGFLDFIVFVDTVGISVGKDLVRALVLLKASSGLSES